MAVTHALVFDASNNHWLCFGRPKKIWCSSDISEVPRVMRQAEDASLAEHTWVLGWVSYEAAPAFDEALRVKTGSEVPLVWFGQYDNPTYLDQLPPPAHEADSPWYSSLSAREYAESFQAVHRHIARGDTYQVNLSFRLKAYEVSDAYALFYSMVMQQAGSYSIFIDAGHFAICCASPELFFEISRGEILCKPMKGTAQRAGHASLQAARIADLQGSEKEQAENVMIVDMVRNDLSRIAQDGSVRVGNLFDVEQYPGVFQMVSEVRAVSNVGFSEVFGALFPSASITGAPKASTMEIITRCENSSRGLYTGSLVVLTPEDRAWCNVAIRTAVIDQHLGSAEYGVGSGVVWDSDWEREYKECVLKSYVVDCKAVRPALLETLRWERDSGYYLLEYHLERLVHSADALGYPCDTTTLRQALMHAEESLDKHQAPTRVRLLLESSGKVRIEVHQLFPVLQPYRVALATVPIRSDDLRLVHKTTDRSIYEGVRPQVPGADDVLLWNERGEVTESRIANLVVSIAGSLFTPPLTSGVLPGCARRDLLERGEITERSLHVTDLRDAERLFLVNSVRGMWSIELLQ